MAVTTIETDYLVVGAGASSMAFVDALIAGGDADVVMVDRRHAPGGHWNNAYPFVRLHQPSANYGVNSRFLGGDRIDTEGPNAGYYERATGVEVCDYFRDVKDEVLLPSGKVRFFPMSEFHDGGSNDHAFTSRLTGRTTTVRVRKRVVDGTYVETALPSTHAPLFTTAEDAWVIPVGDLVQLADAPSGYTVLGSGKTAMDACNWLLDGGVDPDRIRWIRPRDAWAFDRGGFQPLELVVQTFETLAQNVEALAEAETVEDLFARLEASECLVRIDPAVQPTMFRGATLSPAELKELRRIENVVRMGKVLHIGPGRIELEGGTIPTDRSQVHVNCTAYGFGPMPPRPFFEPGRIILQGTMAGTITFSTALAAFVEATRDDDREKNRLCPPVGAPSRAVDWIEFMTSSYRNFAIRAAQPDIAEWMKGSRLNVTQGLEKQMGDPRMPSALARYTGNLEAALLNADRLLAASSAPASAWSRAAETQA